MCRHCQVLCSPKQEKILPIVLGSTIYLARKGWSGWCLHRAVAKEQKGPPTAHVASVSRFSSRAPFSSLLPSAKLDVSELQY